MLAHSYAFTWRLCTVGHCWLFLSRSCCLVSARTGPWISKHCVASLGLVALDSEFCSFWKLNTGLFGQNLETALKIYNTRWYCRRDWVAPLTGPTSMFWASLKWLRLSKEHEEDFVRWYCSKEYEVLWYSLRWFWNFFGSVVSNLDSDKWSWQLWD
jgi:hypothetical protein